MSAADPKQAKGNSEPTAPDRDAEPVQVEDGPRVSVMRVGGEEVVVLSVPLPSLSYPEGTTSAEQEIIDMLLDGLTTKEIATKRGVSVRTVTTQLGVVFQKAGVNSQAELIAMMTQAKPEPSEP